MRCASMYHRNCQIVCIEGIRSWVSINTLDLCLSQYSMDTLINAQSTLDGCLVNSWLIIGQVSAHSYETNEN